MRKRKCKKSSDTSKQTKKVDNNNKSDAQKGNNKRESFINKIKGIVFNKSNKDQNESTDQTQSEPKHRLTRLEDLPTILEDFDKRSITDKPAFDPMSPKSVTDSEISIRSDDQNIENDNSLKSKIENEIKVENKDKETKVGENQKDIKAEENKKLPVVEQKLEK
jgi:hypothetical protein